MMILYVLLALALITVILLIILLLKVTKKTKSLEDIRSEIVKQTAFHSDCLLRMQSEVQNEVRMNKQEQQQYVQTSFNGLGQILQGSLKQSSEAQDHRLTGLNQQMASMAMQNEQKLEHIRATMESRMAAMQEDNGKRLEQMRATVDEKLQKTLEDKIGKSFQLVSERLEQVYKGLGEMQNLASGVGDLKKVLSNVKTRGILGEIQLGSILEQILSRDQYEENIATKKGSSERVEFAIKLPGDEAGTVYLPIDAKFPADAYERLMDAYDNGSKEEVELAAKALEKVIKTFAKNIHDKYIEPPQTTDFGIMFLPFEGLYAEVVRRGLVEVLQREYKINIAGPTTMAALLNSLQMGFKTLAIQKHSGEVWNILGAVKTEFDKFGTVLAATQQRINQANAELDKLVGTRTRSIQRKLRGVTCLSELESRSLLELGENPIGKDNEEEE